MRSLSVACFTNESPRRVAAGLSLFRSIADEIIVAVDASSRHLDRSHLTDVADRVIERDFEWPLEANLKWLHRQCSGEWVLRIDSDEVPSAELVDRLDGSAWDEDVTHVMMARRWLYPTPGQWLDCGPWWPDFQTRLIRNDPEVVKFPSTPHEPLIVEGAHRYLLEPIYHLDLLIHQEAERRTKVRRYARATQRLRTTGNLSMSSYYLPESFPDDLSQASTSDIDEQTIASVLAGTYPDIGPREAAGFVVPIAEDVPIAAESAVVHCNNELLEGSKLEAVLDVTNIGTQSWELHGLIRLGAQWHDAHGNIVYDEARADLTHVVRPGQNTVGRLLSDTPEPGDYLLTVGVVHEHDRRLTRHTLEMTI